MWSDSYKVIKCDNILAGSNLVPYFLFSDTLKNGTFTFYFKPSSSIELAAGFRALVVGANHSTIHQFAIGLYPPEIGFFETNNF